MTGTAKPSEPADGKERVNFGALLPVGLFVLSLLPFGTVRVEHRLALAALAGVAGIALVVVAPREREQPAWARGALWLALGALLVGALSAVPLGPGGRALLQPGLAPLLDQALAVIGEDTHSMVLDPWRGLLEWGLAASLLGVATGTAMATRGPEAGRRLSWGLAGAGALLLLIAVVHRGQGAPSIWWVTGVPAYAIDPFFAPFVSPNHGGAAAAALFGPTLGLVFASTGRARLVAGGLAAGLLLGVASTGSRAAALDAFAAAAVVLSICGGLRLRAAVVAALALAGVVVVVAGPAQVALWLTAQITPELYQNIEAGYSDVLTGRADIWRDTLRIWQAAPWLGVGPGSFDDAYRAFKSTPEFATTAHAHQEVLQILAEHGLIGAALALGAAGTLLLGGARAALRAETASTRALMAGALGGLVALAVDAQLDFPLRIGALATLAAVLAGLLAGLAAVEGRARWTLDVLILPALLGLLAAGTAGGLRLMAQERTDWAPVEPMETRGDHAIRRALKAEDGAEREEQIARAEQAYSEAIRRLPTHRESLQKLGRLRLATGDREGAGAALEAAAAVYPTLPWPWRDLARFRASQGDREGANAAWRNMLALNLPEDGTPYVREALAGARDLRERAEQTLPERADRWVSAARIADEAGDRASAEAFYRRAMAISPAAGIELAGALVRWRRAPEATALLPQLPGSCRKTLVESEIALQDDRFEEARRGFEQALRDCGARERRARLGLARAKAALGDASAIRALEALVEEDPTDTVALRALIREHEALGHLVEARRYRELLLRPAAPSGDEIAVPER